MDCNCNCFGVASAARVPVKRYNLLVPDVFPVTEPSFDKPLGITIERKIKKLAEYLDKNEHRAPKVSRRLQRRMYKELAARRYGYVKLAVQTYSSLLLNSKPEKSNLLANELVVRTVVKRRSLPFGGKYYLPFKEPHLGSVVGLLVTHASPQLRKLGVDLLIDFTKQQYTSDYVPQLEAFVPLLCENASPHVTATTITTTATPAGRAAAAAAVTAATAASEQWAALRAACLRALLEHLRFCARLSYVSYHLHTITFTVLACVEASGHGAPQGEYLSPRAALEAGLNPLDSMTKLSISHVVAASPPDIAALLVFEELAHMTRDAAEGKKVLEFVMRFLDSNGRWLGSAVLETSIAVLQQACEEEHQRYLLYSSLLRHVAAAEKLTAAERAAVLRLAVAESRQLEQGLAAPALLLALRELPAVIASSSGAGEVPPMPALAAAVVAAPPHRQPAAPAAGNGTAALAATAYVQPGAAGDGAPAGKQELELPRLLPTSGRRPPAAALAAVAEVAARAPVDLQAQVLVAVQHLAAGVEEGSQLVEAISGTIIRLRASAPISTAALQCCVAAGTAIQQASPSKAPASRGTASVPRTFPSLLLHQLCGILVSWEPQQRLLAHRLLLELLPAAGDGLKEQQAAMLLSAAWHEAALDGNHPAAFVALDHTLRGLLVAAPAAALPQVVAMLAGLQVEVLQAGSGVGSGDGAPAAAVAPGVAGGSRLAGLSAAQGCALLCVCKSVLHALAAQLGQPLLQQLAVVGCDSVLQCLEVAQPHGLTLLGLPVSSSGGGPDGDSFDAAQQQAQAQFWQGPAVVLAFNGEEQRLAAGFLASWRQQGTTAAQQQEQLAAALAAVPLFRQQQAQQQQVAAAGGPFPANVFVIPFQPMSVSSLIPRIMGAGGAYANGSVTSGEGESKRAQRLRNVYQHMRQISLCDGDRALLATISQESAAGDPAAAAMQLRNLSGLANGGAAADLLGGGGNGGGGKSVDQVLAEVDAALEAAEAAMEQGRSPSPSGLYANKHV